jgi:hypothetical protein
LLSTCLAKFKEKDESTEPTPTPSTENNLSLLCNDENDVDKLDKGTLNEKVEIISEINFYFTMKIKFNEHSNLLNFIRIINYHSKVKQIIEIVILNYSIFCSI